MQHWCRPGSWGGIGCCSSPALPMRVLIRASLVRWYPWRWVMVTCLYVCVWYVLWQAMSLVLCIHMVGAVPFLLNWVNEPGFDVVWSLLIRLYRWVCSWVPSFSLSGHGCSLFLWNASSHPGGRMVLAEINGANASAGTMWALSVVSCSWAGDASSVRNWGSSLLWLSRCDCNCFLPHTIIGLTLLDRLLDRLEHLCWDLRPQIFKKGSPSQGFRHDEWRKISKYIRRSSGLTSGGQELP